MKKTDRSKIPPAGKIKRFRLPVFERINLSNGMTVLFAPVHTTPLVNFRLCLHSGALTDHQGKEGLAGLTAELISEGTVSRTSEDIALELDQLGAEFENYANWNGSFFNLNIPARLFENGADVFFDCLFNPAFPEKEFLRIREELLAERMRSVDNSAQVASEYFARFLYGNHRYAFPLEGMINSLSTINCADIPENYRNIFCAKNCFAVITGDVKKTQQNLWLEKYLERIPNGKRVQHPEKKSAKIKGVQIILANKPGAVQSEIRVGHSGIPRKHPDFFAVTVMNQILGGMFSSRINLNLREKHGYTYGAQSNFVFRKQPGPFYVSTAVQVENTAASVAEIIFELNRIREFAVDSSELQNAIGYLTGAFPLSFETISQLARLLTRMEIYNLGDTYYDTYREQISAVTIIDVRRAAENHIDTENLLITIVGDASKVRKGLDALGSVSVHEIISY